jgi:GxxExxY protein
MNYLHENITKEIIGAAIDVHNTLGVGFQEVVYARALAYELFLRKIPFEREVSMDIYYKNLPKPIGTSRVDFLVDKSIIVEIKATTKLDDVHLAQTLNYLKVYKIKIGLMFNFGEKKLAFKRVIY